MLAAACFVDANLEDARIDEGAILAGAIFCRTIKPDGSVDNSGCDNETACCPACPAGQTLCAGACRTLHSDADHCGSRGNGCGE